MNKKGILNLKYSLTQVFYFAAYCGLMGYASVYLLGKGVSNTLIGTTLALVSIITVVTQPLIASIVDRRNLRLQSVINLLLIIAVALSIVLAVLPMSTIALLCVFVGIVTCIMTVQPLFNSLAFVFEKYGIEINFGLARGLGSAAYAFASMALGYMVEGLGASVIPWVYIIFNILLIVVVYTYVIPSNMEKVDSKENVESSKEEQLSFGQFCVRYKKFMLFVLGTVLVFFTHTLVNNFFIQIITPIGGKESHMGNAVFIAAIVELPAMAMINVVKDKVKCSTLLKISAVMFTLKHLITYLAGGMMMIYVAQALQMGAYAVFIPASVYYVNDIVSKHDLVKGQSMVTMGITASGIIANLAGGILLDVLEVKSVLLIGVVISVIGMLIVFMSVQSPNKQ